jgi:AraC-like DNA-binding protein
MKYVRVPSEMTTAPCDLRALKINGLSIVESCRLDDHAKGTMLLEEHLLLCVLQGENLMTHGKTSYHLGPYEMILLKKNSLVHYDKTVNLEKNARYESMLFFLKDEFLQDFIRIANIKDMGSNEMVPISVKPVNERMGKFFESVLPYFNEPDNVDQGLLKIKMLELLYDVAATDKDLLQQLLQMKKPVKADLPEVMETNFANPITMEQLAYLSGRSLASFKRDFNDLYNMPPSEWIRIRRLNKAKEVLENTDLSVLDVCYMVGFENPSHFSRIFKEQFGYSPSAGRQTVIEQ